MTWALARAGYQLRRARAVDTTLLRRDLMSVLAHAAPLGLSPATVIDVGVAAGTPGLMETFPDAEHVLLEPLEEYAPALRRLAQRPKVRYIAAAAGAMPCEVTFHVHPGHLEGSTVLDEPGKKVITRSVPMIRLDDLELMGPFLVKVDVQGAELDVLAGAERILGETEMVVLEVSLFHFWPGGADFVEVIDWMRARAFVPYDIFGGRLRHLDGALAQVDIAFVKADGPLRRSQVYASPEQWRELLRD